jgi:tetratricopeptide (TPR) repeat protein
MALSFMCTSHGPLAAKAPARASLRRPLARQPLRARRFDASDPLSWGSRSDDDGSFMSEDPEEPLQQLTEAEFNALLLQQVDRPPASATPRDEQPTTAAQSIASGLAAFKAGQWEEALEAFTQAEALPGSGVLRVKGKPRDLSQGELQAARYNAAAALSKLDRLDEALDALRGALSAGFEQYDVLQSDPDLGSLRSGRPAEWAALVAPLKRTKGPLDWLLRA